ncbi:hypothetical protein GCM10010912_04710 [Paenibacillus albidus]|uniref:N-acetyltransferase domain-containing protein n=1 Tax=Paenibacillus albidus TaxID=2041023 RepID=A0A917BZE0_9BACL|nr:GNAT family N-acetyltransferase [Paenibacillus albidus]GGF62646.1 hypothetical protein GCM10010912_04710 [Paenibacillus albidus]
MNPIDTIQEKLRENPLKNVSLLKMLSSFHSSMTTHLIEEDGNWGILLLLPAAAYSYDHRTYPQADYIVFMDYSSPKLFPALLRLLPYPSHLVFKLQDEQYMLALANHFDLHKARVFFSYTTTEAAQFLRDEQAVRSDVPDERLIPLWAGNHYTWEEMGDYFREGAFSLSIFEAGVPVSTCLAFKNEEQIWEIGAVYTIESARGKGYARSVVSSALQEVLEQGNLPRYHVLETNLPSIRLAESIGLVRCVTLGHWTNYKQSFTNR